jgi:hypothetical protein
MGYRARRDTVNKSITKAAGNHRTFPPPAGRPRRHDVLRVRRLPPAASPIVVTVVASSPSTQPSSVTSFYQLLSFLLAPSAVMALGCSEYFLVRCYEYIGYI